MTKNRVGRFASTEFSHNKEKPTETNGRCKRKLYTPKGLMNVVTSMAAVIGEILRKQKNMHKSEGNNNQWRFVSFVISFTIIKSLGVKYTKVRGSHV